MSFDGENSHKKIVLKPIITVESSLLIVFQFGKDLLERIYGVNFNQAIPISSMEQCLLKNVVDIFDIYLKILKYIKCHNLKSKSKCALKNN